MTVTGAAKSGSAVTRGEDTGKPIRQRKRKGTAVETVPGGAARRRVSDRTLAKAREVESKASTPTIPSKTPSSQTLATQTAKRPKCRRTRTDQDPSKLSENERRLLEYLQEKQTGDESDSIPVVPKSAQGVRHRRKSNRGTRLSEEDKDDKNGAHRMDDTMDDDDDPVGDKDVEEDCTGAPGRPDLEEEEKDNDSGSILDVEDDKCMDDRDDCLADPDVEDESNGAPHHEEAVNARFGGESDEEQEVSFNGDRRGRSGTGNLREDNADVVRDEPNDPAARRGNGVVSANGLTNP